MKKSTKQHLENITIDDLLDFKSSAFLPFASCTANGKVLNLGVSGDNEYVVNAYTNGKLEVWRFNQPFDAIEKYTELCTE